MKNIIYINFKEKNKQKKKFFKLKKIFLFFLK
jgi:hypothetical protein